MLFTCVGTATFFFALRRGVTTVPDGDTNVLMGSSYSRKVFPACRAAVFPTFP